MILGMAGRFAEGTEVPTFKTKGEIEQLLARNQATQISMGEDSAEGKAVVMFRMTERIVKLRFSFPTLAECAPDKQPKPPQGSWRWEASKKQVWASLRQDQAKREAWRRLLLIVKAKLELVANGGSTVEREFLADIVMTDGSTVGDNVLPRIAEAYQTGNMPKLLGAG
jgi:hypothetical protein